MASTIQLQNFIDGALHPPKSGNYITSLNPATGQPYCLVPDSTEDDVEMAVAAATKAFPGWSETTRQERSRVMNKIADLIESRLDAFAEAESRDQGKPFSLAKRVDIPRAVHNFRFFASYILHMEDKKTEMDGVAINYVHRYPVGVAGLISPWNLPLYLATWKLAPAIASGCTCVLKPSEFTSATAHLLSKVLIEANLPNGVINIVFGDGPKAGSALVNHPKVPLISFTGGTLTGQTIFKNCSTQFKKMSLELGGKNANIIFADADFDKALATSVRSSFLNQGEICLCGSRIFVEAPIYEKFVEHFVEKASNLVVGDPSDPATDLGALVSEQHLRKVLGYVELAREEGGTVLCGGEALKGIKNCEGGFFMRPTIVTGVLKEEIFGPVVTIVPFTSEEEVIGFANSTEYGLSASIWTENLKRAHRVSHKLHVGTAWVNCWMVRDLNMPFGGSKASGIGREGAPYSFDFFCEETTVCIAMD
ncbi:Aldehyde dehydrogenase 8 member A1 [Dinochytrium kinnereticum]|nr:Aldehyde dehydrogenase 8 member A1 [Dinochytrium kinnereticum]